METLVAEATTYGTLFGIEFGHWIGAAAVMFFVMMRSILWYAIPNTVQWHGETLSLGRADSGRYHRVSSITNTLTAALLGYSAYLVGMPPAIIYLAIVANIFLLVRLQETVRKDESMEAAGFDSWDTAVNTYVEQYKQRKQDTTAQLDQDTSVS